MPNLFVKTIYGNFFNFDNISMLNMNRISLNGKYKIEAQFFDNEHSMSITDCIFESREEASEFIEYFIRKCFDYIYYDEGEKERIIDTNKIYYKWLERINKKNENI